MGVYLSIEIDTPEGFTMIGKKMSMEHHGHGAIDPVATYRKAGYRQHVAELRPAVAGGGGGIV